MQDERMLDPRIDLINQKVTLAGYCASKMKANDWHAVQDAASDIREIDAKLELLDEQAIKSAGVK
jgi:hypothetical protein